jgi:hypothetical protein
MHTSLTGNVATVFLYVQPKWRSDGPVNINKKECMVTITDGACATLACSLPASRGLSYFEVGQRA